MTESTGGGGTIVGGIEVEGGAIRYERAGVGEAIVFLHAGVADRRMWRAQVSRFSAEYLVLAYDMRGYGESPWPSADFSPLTDLESVLDALRVERPHLVGCSKGGELVLDFALEVPERVASLTLVGASVSGWESPRPQPPGYEEMVAAFRAGDLDAAADAGVRMWLVGARRTPDSVSEEIRSLGRSMGRIILANQASGGGRELLVAEPALARLEHVRAPTLVVTGSLDDDEILEIARILAERIPGSRSLILEGAGHLSPLERPDAFNNALAGFLGGLSG